MMIKEIKYRLGEYIIIEHDGVLLTWISPNSLGSQLCGRCFVIGDILVIGPWDHEEPGYLELEFHEHLMKLPGWNKTSHYCFISSIHKVGAGQNLTNDLIEQLSKQKIAAESFIINEPGMFRLERYKITVDENNTISWQTIKELDRIIGGTGVIESGILIICLQEITFDKSQRRQQFLTELKELPQWDKTLAWMHYGSLMICGDPGRRGSYGASGEPEQEKARTIHNVPSPRGQAIRNARISQFNALDFEWLLTAWRRVLEWKVWGLLVLLITGCVFFVLGALLLLLEKSADLSLRIINKFLRKS